MCDRIFYIIMETCSFVMMKSLIEQNFDKHLLVCVLAQWQLQAGEYSVE